MYLFKSDCLPTYPQYHTCNHFEPLRPPTLTMAVELVGTTIGVVGLLGQLFDGCVKAYSYFTAAQHLDVDSQRLICKVRIEEMRLLVWGREWGVAEGKLESHLSQGEKGMPGMREVAKEILEQLHGTVTDVKRLKGTYGLVDRDEGGRRLDEKGKKEKNGAKVERSWKKEFQLKSKWVIGGSYSPFPPFCPLRKLTSPDKDKFTSLLKDLKEFNDGLERLFPLSHIPSYQRSWTNQLLASASRDTSELSLLEKASSETYPQLNASANLKKLRINLDKQPQSTFQPTPKLKVQRDALTLSDEADSKVAKEDEVLRCHGLHETSGPVLIEWLVYEPTALDERLLHLRRMDDLARLIHSASTRHPDLHSIDCLGYTDDTANARYGLVYRAPATSSSSLHTLISSSDLKTPDLDDRIRLATTLAVACWSLHSLDWLHKSLCSRNILFFPSGVSAAAQGATASAALIPDITSPYVTGFTASRPDLESSLSLIPRNPSITTLHRHPSSLRGYAACKAFDIYSLGLVLLEIGLWKVMETYHKPHYSADRWRDKVVLPVLVPGLGSKMGRRYREAVELCLGVGEGVSSCEAGEVMEEVVGKLEGIRL